MSLAQKLFAMTAHATPNARLSLAVIVVAAVVFTIGVVLARQQRIEAHRWVQTTGVLLTAALGLTWMLSSLRHNVLPQLPGRLHESPYLWAAVHAATGIVAVAVGLYVASVGNRLLPARLSFTRFKPYMRSSYALYLLATLTGVVLYVAAYVGL